MSLESSTPKHIVGISGPPEVDRYHVTLQAAQSLGLMIDTGSWNDADQLVLPVCVPTMYRALAYAYLLSGRSTTFEFPGSPEGRADLVDDALDDAARLGFKMLSAGRFRLNHREYGRDEIGHPSAVALGNWLGTQDEIQAFADFQAARRIAEFSGRIVIYNTDRPAEYMEPLFWLHSEEARGCPKRAHDWFLNRQTNITATNIAKHIAAQSWFNSLDTD